jgi:hypothetical protein
VVEGAICSIVGSIGRGAVAVLPSRIPAARMGRKPAQTQRSAEHEA